MSRTEWIAMYYQCARNALALARRLRRGIDRAEPLSRVASYRRNIAALRGAA